MLIAANLGDDEMSNRETHMLAGFAFGSLGYALVKIAQNEEVDLGHAIGWGVVGAGVATLPDIIEPATGPLHRAFAHSFTAGGLVALSTKIVYDNPNLTSDEKAAFVSVASAFGSHLLLDAGTPAGLPLY